MNNHTKRKTKKKGFTLVELLAVIVILAIILVIAIPSILETINTTRKNSIESSVKLVADALEREYYNALVLDKVEEFKNREKDCMTIGNLGSDYKSCTYEFNEDTKEITVCIEGQGKFNGYIAKGDKNHVESVETCTPNVEQLTNYAYGNPTTSSPTTPPEGHIVYNALYPTGEKAVCIKRNGTEHCFKNNNWDVEKDHVQQVFSDVTCNVESYGAYCVGPTGTCNVESTFVACFEDEFTSVGCFVFDDGDADCY